jgi:hypothetical protein
MLLLAIEINSANIISMKQITIVILIIFGNSFLFGQQEPEIAIPQNDRYQIVSLAWTPITLAGYTTGVSDAIVRFFVSNNFEVIEGKYGVRGVAYNPAKSTGGFILAYERTLSKRTSVRICMSYEMLWRKWDLYVNANSPHFFSERFHIFQMLPEIRFDYVSRERIALFTSAGVGLGSFFNTRGKFGDIIENQNGFDLAFQIFLLGLEARLENNMLIRFKTLGLGTVSTLELGVGYRF